MRSHAAQHSVKFKNRSNRTVDVILSNCAFPYRWSSACLRFTVVHVTSIFTYFYTSDYIYITRRTINNNTPNLKSPKTKQKSRLGTDSKKITGRGGGGGASTSLRSTNPRPLFCLGSSDTQFFGLHGRFLAHKYIILET